MSSRLAIVLSHPTQYYSPWFRHLGRAESLELKVFYLWDSGVTPTVDKTFGKEFMWDIPLLDGYEHEFITNVSADPGTHHFRGLNNPECANAIKRWRPDVVLLFGYNFLTHLRLILTPGLRNVPYLFRGDSHELFPEAGWKPKVKCFLRQVLFLRFQGFLAVGEANAEYFQKSGVPKRKIHRVPHCVDNDRFQAAGEMAEVEATDWKSVMGIANSSTVVLFAGKFEEKKRPLDLLAAFLAISLSPSSSDLRSSPPVLLFIGSGPLERELREAAGSKLDKSIYFAPFQNQLAMPKAYATADVLVLPSYGRSETWGLAVNEAMNLAKPVIVSSHVGCGPDLILQGETGWVFPAGDVDALTQTLSVALADPARLKQMGHRAKEHITNYSYARATHALCDVLGRA